MGRPSGAARVLVACLLLVSAVAASAQPIVDGLESEPLGPLWWLRAEAGRVTVQREVVHYFRLGLCRNRMAQPMVLHFDDSRTERLAK